MWKAIRIGFLLLVLAAVALQAWLDRVSTQSWQETLWVGIFPLNGDGTPQARRYIDGLSVKDFAGIEDFFAREAHRYGVKVTEPKGRSCRRRLHPVQASCASRGGA